MTTSDIIYTHHLSSYQKLYWWGAGEWVYEADEARFTHRGVECRVVRSGSELGIILGEDWQKCDHCYGGFLCGYVQISLEHPWAKKDWIDIYADVHGGLTYGQAQDDQTY